MAERDLVGSLKAAIERADPTWVTQPSHLRRRLDEELGPDARTYRAQVHQLIVAAEERVPIRLQRHGWSPSERTELVELLVGARGWTVAASDWAVVTWAAALDLCDERPPVAPGVPSPREANPEPEAADPTERRVSIARAEPTVLPSEPVVVASTDVAPEESVHAVQSWSSDAITSMPAPSFSVAPPSDPPPADVVETGPSAPLPRRGTRGITRKTAKILDRDVDVAYLVKAGPSPAWLYLLLVLGVLVLVATGYFPLVVFFAFALAWTFWPSRILAVSGNDVWLLGATRFAPKPTDVLAETRRDLIEFSGGWPLPSVRVGGQRLWFPAPVARAARRLPTGAVGSRP